jgi:hypothetical protein
VHFVSGLSPQGETVGFSLNDMPLDLDNISNRPLPFNGKNVVHMSGVIGAPPSAVGLYYPNVFISFFENDYDWVCTMNLNNVKTNLPRVIIVENNLYLPTSAPAADTLPPSIHAMQFSVPEIIANDEIIVQAYLQDASPLGWCEVIVLKPVGQPAAKGSTCYGNGDWIPMPQPPLGHTWEPMSELVGADAGMANGPISLSSSPSTAGWFSCNCSGTSFYPALQGNVTYSLYVITVVDYWWNQVQDDGFFFLRDRVTVKILNATEEE